MTREQLNKSLSYFAISFLSGALDKWSSKAWFWFMVATMVITVIIMILDRSDKSSAQASSYKEKLNLKWGIWVLAVTFAGFNIGEWLVKITFG